MAVSEKLIAQLNDLLMLDHDAVDAYEQAIKRMSHPGSRTQLGVFQADHRRHIADLKDCIVRYGGRPHDRRDVKGFFMKGMTALQSMAGDEMALKAMLSNEKFTNSRYEEAAHEASFPDDVRALVAKNRADEARHLDWIEKAIDRRFWETAETPVP
jgi:rubrerythrin